MGARDSSRCYEATRIYPFVFSQFLKDLIFEEDSNVEMSFVALPDVATHAGMGARGSAGAGHKPLWQLHFLIGHSCALDDLATPTWRITIGAVLGQEIFLPRFPRIYGSLALLLSPLSLSVGHPLKVTTSALPFHRQDSLRRTVRCANHTICCCFRWP